MKLLVTLFLGSCFTFVFAAPTQDDKEFESWMKTTQSTVGSLRKNIEAKANDAAAQDAEKLADIFKKVEGFWQARHTDDAVKWSQQATTAAKEVSAAAKGGDYEKVGAGMKSFMSTCMACHTAHREKLPEGGYKIK
jgi:cytochrome c556